MRVRAKKRLLPAGHFPIGRASRNFIRRALEKTAAPRRSKPPPPSRADSSAHCSAPLRDYLPPPAARVVLCCGRYAIGDHRDAVLLILVGRQPVVTDPTNVSKKAQVLPSGSSCVIARRERERTFGVGQEAAQ